MSRGKNKAKSGKPLSARKGIQATNKKMVDFFASQLNSLRTDVGKFQEQVAESNQQLWQNQQKQSNGLTAAEHHVVLLRRVLNDALGGVTRVKTIERKNPPAEDVQVIDWGWYAEQLHYSDNNEEFMNGEVLQEEEVEKRKEKEELARRQQHVLQTLWKAAESDEDALRAAYDAGGLSDVLKPFVLKGAPWEAQEEKMAEELAENVLKQREAAREQQKKIEAAQERALLKGVLVKLHATDEGIVGYSLGQLTEAVQGAMPSVVKWTDSMEKILPELAVEVATEFAERTKENDPEEVEAEKQKLLEETKKFGEDARGVIDLIEAGNETEARKRMAELEQKVKDKEAEADLSTAKPIPDGATVFGG